MSKEQLSFEDFRALHLDFTSLPGKELVARLAGLESHSPDVQLALKLLRAWDGRLDPNSVGGSLYEVARYTLVRELLEPCLGTDLTMRMMGLGFHPLLHIASEILGHDTVFLLRLLDNPQSWSIQKAGGREAVLTSSLQKAVEWLRDEMGPDVKGWQWGKLHQLTFNHTLALKKPMDKVFNRGPIPMGGDTDTPCQTATLPDNPYGNNAWSPSVRFIMDMGDLSRSVAVFPPGQSGQLGSPHYDDLIEPWQKGDYHPMLWTDDQVEQGKKHTLRLRPGAA